ncbi:hypothetical protein BGZ80_002668 [Entomortierella chlamydospora]|uniref:tRNA-uridine aminocarboxypropyltransferase n=1 Tax=Entomortierella chlamydospora TaxID=101097 RepID=A0A9P6MP42_9FUNG|nr:hypothetical protein BGZ79_006077 [Entomortierella chlamydospora]KAG0009171.1 hypothetical protein BGZ80_002668 [Entomortierella chlamydospora]
MSTAGGQSVQFADLPDKILLAIFDHVVSFELRAEIQNDNGTLQDLNGSESQASVTVAESLPGSSGTDHVRKSKNKAKKARMAGLGARTLFSDRHWPTTDQKNLELIKVRREHQLKLLKTSVNDKDESIGSSNNMIEGRGSRTTSSGGSDDGVKEHDGDDSQEGGEDGQRKKQKRTKFYSRFEQRAHRRKFGSLDPELKYTPLAWTNTLWSWKRTYFGDCRFIESEDVKTPNRIASRQYCNCRVRIMILQHPRCQVSIGTIRILKLSFKYCQIIIGKDFKAGRSLELDQALEDPNCTPLLLYPSHSAIDIQALALEPSQPTNPSTPESNYETLALPSARGASYPYKLVIALDGSWSHAKIMYRCNPRLQQLTQIKFPNPPQSIYHDLKPEPKPTYTSTAEAVGQAVALLGWPESNHTDLSKEGQDKSLTNAQLLLEDLIRPLKIMIEIQDTIAQDQHKQVSQEIEVEQEHE